MRVRTSLVIPARCVAITNGPTMVHPVAHHVTQQMDIAILVIPDQAMPAKAVVRSPVPPEHMLPKQMVHAWALAMVIIVRLLKRLAMVRPGHVMLVQICRA